jgi:hypothetical protein
MPASRQMKSIFRRNESHVALTRELKEARGHPSPNMRSPGVDARRDPAPCVMHARGNPMSAIGFYRRGATAESCQEDGGAERE